jgi:hypothetical protein
MGGDGMQIQIDKRNPNIVFTGFQFEIIIESIVPQTNASTFRQSRKKMKTISFQLANTYFIVFSQSRYFV